MNILALDTATEACSLALACGDAVLVRHEVVGREHSARLLPLFHELLAEAGLRPAQLDALVCGVGPGSFAGVRIGVGFAKGLALARALPVAPVSTLATLAQGAMRRHAVGTVLACIDARMNEVYAGLYGCDAGGSAQPLEPERVCPPQELPALSVVPQAAAGSGWRAYEQVLRARVPGPYAVDPDALPEAQDSLRLGRAALAVGGGLGAEALTPVYLRDSVALTLEQQAAARRRRIAKE